MTQIEVHPKGNLADEISQRIREQFSSQLDGDQIDLKFFEYRNLGFEETLVITIVGLVGTTIVNSVTELVKYLLTESKKKNKPKQKKNRKKSAPKEIEIKIILQDEGKIFVLPEDEILLFKMLDMKKGGTK